jgi:glutamine synthetase
MATRRPRRPGPDLIAQARQAGVRLVRFLYTDNGGVTRGKATHVDGLARSLTDGIGLTGLMATSASRASSRTGQGWRSSPPRAATPQQRSAP